MGLDMCAFKTKTHHAKPVDFYDRSAEVIHRWRKHPNLHGWMEDLYRTKGGKLESFNCSPVMLDLADLEELEHAIRGGTLPVTSGFFFGRSDGTERHDDLAFIVKARHAICAGYTVFYDSWW